MRLHVMFRLLVVSLIPLSTGADAAGAGAPLETLVTIESGTLQGTLNDGVIAFKGIPFAAPPSGALRWRGPQSAAKWGGVRDASAYGNDCMQLPFPSDAAPLGTLPAEDCLYANIWRPATKQTKLPVLVWIYGGGFVNGGASPPTYSGAELAEQGILFFSFNYRLGRFGTFGHPQLSAESGNGGELGNYNHMDQIAALRWVQRNIEAFGGDSSAVTIVGESAGGRSVHTLMTSPQTKGLFTRAVVQSGGGGDNVERGGTLTSLQDIGVAFAQNKGIVPKDPAALAKLRALSPEQVVDGLNLAALFTPSRTPGALRTWGRAISDGKVVVDSLEAYRAGIFHHVPMMIGATSDDIGGRTGYMIAGARDAARLLTEKGVPIFYYRFSYVAESLRASTVRGAPHASEIPFFLHTEAIKYGDATSDRDRQAGRIASAYLVNFVKTGNPNGPKLPQWPRYESKTDSMLDFSMGATAVPGPDPWRKDLDAAAAKAPSDE
jgi:para-nitrobenzyl esterase